MKVLVADDELPIREWLRITIQELGEDLEVLTAGNGKEAFELYQEKLPKLIVTDIKMPRMDGLELLQKIKERDPKAYVVMLTSYGEFEYAREAIKYQANEYVLKNEITKEGLLQILNNFSGSMRRSGGEIVTDCLKDLMEKGELKELAEPKEHARLFAAAFPGTDPEGVSFEPYLNSFVEQIQVFLYDKDVIVWLCTCKNLSSSGTSFHEAMSFCQKLSGLREVSVGFSGFARSGTEACIRAGKALGYCFYENRRGVFSYEGEEKSVTDRLLSVRRQAVALLRQGRKKEADERIQELLAEIEKGRVLDVEFVRACCQDLVDGCKVANIEFAGDGLEEICKRTKGEIGEAASFSRLKAVTEGFFEELEGTMLVQEKPYHKYVKLALAYVKDNYAVIESLAEVAGYVNLNTEYFCRIFKAEVGTTFNNYLTEYRVKKAIELLEGTDLKVYEVAEKVGYTNLSYFSRVFKKVTGENPFVYKN